MGGRGSSYKKTRGGGGGGIAVAPPTPTLMPTPKTSEQLELEKIIGEQGEPKDIFVAQKDTNPNFDKNSSYHVNCQRCYTVYELNRRGFDVEALPKKSYQSTLPYTNKVWLNDDGTYAEYTSILPDNFGRLKRKTSASSLAEAEMLKYPEGSRFAIKIMNTPIRGHIFNAEIKNGKVMYVDGQHFLRTSALMKESVDHVSKSYKNMFDPSGWRNSLQIMRVDDKKLTTDLNLLSTICKKKGS